MESAKFAVLTVSDKLCICDVSTKLNRISYTLLKIRAIKAAEGDSPPGGGGGRGGLNKQPYITERPRNALCLSVVPSS